MQTPARACGHEIAESFVLIQKIAGRDEEWLDAAVFCCDDLHHFKINYADGRAAGWTAALVEEYLLDYFPRKVSADEDSIAKTPEILTAFFDWAEQAGHVGSRAAEAIRKRIKSIRKRFDAAARDPGNFGMAKSLVMGMQDADITKQKEVDSYIKTRDAGRAVFEPRAPDRLHSCAVGRILAQPVGGRKRGHHGGRALEQFLVPGHERRTQLPRKGGVHRIRAAQKILGRNRRRRIAQ